MKNLLRMSLFIIARAGLCLAVVAWIVSQWWVGSLYGHNVNLTCKPNAWTARVGPSWPDSFRLEIHSSAFLRDGGNDSPHWVQYRWGANPSTPGAFQYSLCLHSIAEIHWKFPPARFRVMVSHWLSVSLFTAFSIALHFIYRKRPEGQPCEV